MGSIIRKAKVQDVPAIIDYWVANQDWEGAGTALLEAAVAAARERGAVQCVVVCANKDEAKRSMLSAAAHTIGSEWWVRPI